MVKKVLKFGGTSVGTIERIQQLCNDKNIPLNFSENAD